MSSNPFSTSPFLVPETTEPAKSPVSRGLAPSRDDLIKRARELDVDPNLALSIFSQESSGNWSSKDSPKGARGGMQVMPGTYRSMMGTDAGQDDPWNNMEAGLRYLAHGQRTLGTRDPELLAAGYHAGYGRKELKEGSIPDASDGLINTRDYASTVAGRLSKYRNKEQPKDDTAPMFVQDNETAPMFVPETDKPEDADLTKERPGIFEQAANDFERGLINLKSFGYGAAALASDAAGLDGATESLLQGYMDSQKQAEKIAPVIGTYRNIHSFGDAGRYAVEAVAENLPMMLPSLVTGGVGAIAARKAAEKVVAGMIEKQIASGVARELAERNAAGFVAKRLAQGAAAGAGAASVGMESGSIYGDVYEQTGEKRPGVAATFGLAAGALDAIPAFMAIKKAIGPAADQVADYTAKAIVKRFGKEALKQFGAEGITEGMQTVIESGAVRFVDGKPLFNDKLFDEVIDSALKGGIGGAAIGAGSQGVADIRSALKAPTPSPDAVQEDAVPSEKPKGPLSGAMEKAAQGGDRVTATDQAGNKVSGTIAETDGKRVTLVDDEGNAVAINLDAMKVEREQGPLSSAVEAAADAHAEAPITATDSAVPDQHIPDGEGITQEPRPAPQPKADYNAMTEDDLRARLRYIADQAKNNGGWNTMLTKERAAVEKAINAKAKAAETPKVEQPSLDFSSAKPEDAAPVAKSEQEQTAQVTQPAQSGTTGEGAGASQPTQAAPKTKTASKEDLEHLLGIDKKREKALERIAKGTAYFHDGVKAKDFIKKNGLSDTHEVKQGNGGRWDIVAKATGKESLTVQPSEVAKAAAAKSLAEGGTEADANRAATDALIEKMADNPGISISTEAPAAVAAAKKELEAKRGTNERTSGKPAGAEEVGEKADAGQGKAAAVQPASNEKVTPSSRVVRTYTTRGGAVGAEIKENTGPDGKLSYSYNGKWGAGSGHDAENMRQIEDQWHKSKSGYTLKENGNADGSEFGTNGKTTESRASAEQAADVTAGREVREEGRGQEEVARPTVSENKVFTEDAAQRARELLKKRLSGAQLNSGIDPEVMQAGITLAGYHIEKGARTFAAYAKAMIDDLGDVVKPYLKSWYLATKFDPRAAGFTGMDDTTTVESADIEEITRAESGSIAEPEEQKPSTLMDRVKAARKAESKKDDANTEDAGEELKYNKRGRKSTLSWDDLKDQDAALRVSNTNKAKVLEKPDYQKLIDDGMHQYTAYIVKQVYDSIAAKPQTRTAPTDEQLQNYITGSNRVMEGVMKWANGDGAKSWLSRIGASAATQLSAMRGERTSISDMAVQQGDKLLDVVYPEGWRSQQDELRLIGSNKVLAALQPGLDDARKAGKEIDKGWPAKMEAWQKQGYKIAQVDQPQLIATNYYEGKRRDGTPYVSVRMTYSKNRQQFLLYGAVIEAESKNDEAVTKAVDAVTEDVKAGKLFLVDKAGNAIGSYDTLESAQEAARDKAKRDTGGNVIDERGISVEMARRTGKDRRMEGEDVTSERLMEEFGFRGVNFGNWLKGKSNSAERQLHLNHAYDSFMDLADVLGVPPKAMSLNGMLGIAIGAQGNGKAAAHFVPGLNEINITRTAGAGALAHEWGHALDHYFARLAGLDRETDPFLTEHATKAAEITRSVPDPENPRKLKVEKLPRFAAELRPEVLEKFKAIVTAMNKRELTPGEIEMRRADSVANAKKQLDGWLASIKRDFRSPSMVQAGKAVPEADFDAVAERIRKLDLGDGTVAIGKTAYVSPVVDELRSLYKKATGSTYSIDNTKALQQWVDYLKRVSEEKADAKTHVPQMTTTTFAAEAAKLDKDKGGKKYWSTDIEKFARAFDAYVSDKLAEKAMKNTYLAGLNNGPMTSPMGEERKAINNAFDGLVETIETREEGGKIILSDNKLEGEEDAADNRGGDGRRGQAGNDAGDDVQQADARRREAFESLREFAGIAIATRIESQGASALVGASAGSPKDLAAAAQIYRNPRFETSRVVFIRGGRVVFEAGVTSRLPGYVAAVPATMGEREFYRWIGDQKDRLNADGYYLMHNHPSGDPTPSGDDVAATVKMAGEVAGFLGHVIINSNKYAVIDANGNGEVRTEYFGEDNLLKASKPHELLNRQLASMEDLAVLGKSLQQDGYVTLIGIASKKIRAITSFPLEQYKTAKEAKIATRYVARKSGSSQVFVVGDVAGIQHHQELIEKGFIAAAIDADGKLIYGRVRQGMQFGINANDVAKMSTRGEAANADAIEVDGVLRLTTNSNGKPIAQTEEGLRNFWRWFGDSKVVDGQGRPLVVYHGTNKDFDTFRTSIGSHFGGIDQASDILAFVEKTEGIDGANIMPVYLSIKNPKRVRDMGSNPISWAKQVSKWRDEGFDGLVYRNAVEGNGGDSYVAFERSQIKSAIGNRGTFDGTNPDIRASRDGSIDPAAAMAYVEDNFWSILEELNDAKLVEIVC